MENVVVIGVLAALWLASEWWLRRHETRTGSAAETVPMNNQWNGLPPLRRLPTGEVPFDALQGPLSTARRPPTMGAN